jgi:molecular chaperone IbpA
MGTIDFAPLFRSTVGFDRLFDLLDRAAGYEAVDNYPPYNIEKVGEDTYHITMAVAGFGVDDLSIIAQPNLLVVAGQKSNQNGIQGQYLHQGLSMRAFERRFNLADYVQVKGATLENGLLSVELVREIPEAMKPRTIQIGGTSQPKTIESKVGESKEAA